MRRFSLGALLLLLATSSPAATRTWGGSTNGQWTVASNWDFSILPVAGDTLHFEPGGLNLTNTNDFPSGTSFAAIIVDGPGYVLNGNQVALGSLTASAAGPVAVNLPIQLANPTTSFSVTAGTLNLGSPVDLNGNNLTLNATGGASATESGVISGAGTITKIGFFDWTLSGVNTFTGPVTVHAGQLIVDNGSALGVGDNTLGNATFANSGGALTILGVNLGNEYVQIDSGGTGNGALQSLLAGSTLNGTLELGTSAVVGAVAPGTLTLNGPIVGPGRFFMDGDSTLIINSSNNNFAGVVAWNPSSGASTLRVGGTNSLPVTTGLDIPSGAHFDLNGQTQTLTYLFGNGGVNLGGGGTLTIAGGPTSDYVGVISGTGTVIHNGGTLMLRGTSTYSGTYSNLGGTTELIGGTLPATYTQTAGTFGPSSNAAAGSVTILGGTFFPGENGAGIANTGNLTFSPGTTYQEIINGNFPGPYGNVHVAGTVNLAGATLALTGSGAVAPGNILTVIDNDGSDPVIGTFAGLPQGSVIPGGPGGFSYVITYTGGSGNDVVLTAVAATSIPALDPRALAALALVLGVIAIIALRRL